MEDAADDADFDLTAEMMIHDDIDDESTLEDEDEQDSDELDNLQVEGELPLEELLMRYGYGGQADLARKDEGCDSSSHSSLSESEHAPSVSQSSSLPGSSSVHHDNLHSPTSLLQTSAKDNLSPFQLMPPLLGEHSEQFNSKVEPSNELLNVGYSGRGPPPLVEIKRPVVNHSSSEPYDERGVQGPKGLLSKKVLIEAVSVQNCSPSKSILGKRTVGSAYNDVLLPSKHHTILTEDILSKTSSHVTMATNSSHWVRSGRLRRELPDRRSGHLVTDDGAIDAYISSLLDVDSDGSDSEYVPREDWKQEIKVGPQYQAVVPDISLKLSPNSSYRATPTCKLKWRPDESCEDTVSEYLEAITQLAIVVHCNSKSDNEQALEVLQSCGHNVDEAIDLINKDGFLEALMEPWSDSECQSFEEGLKLFGKDFFRIQKQVPSRTVKELIEFYYTWKKSERCDLFIQQHGKIGRRKLVVPPGHVSDFMNRYLDLYSEDTPDIHYAATTIYAEAKKEST